MKAIIKSRQAGKTHDLIEMANKVKGNYNLIVGATRMHAEEIWKRILEKKYDLPMPISFQEFTEGKYQKVKTKIFIDDLDWCLQLKQAEIFAVTLNTDGREIK